MPRDLVYGNGRFYVAMDRRGLIRELCWPVVGAPNHLAGRKIRLGIRRDNGWFSWLGDEGWEVIQWYEEEVGMTEWRGFDVCIVRRAWMDGDVFHQLFDCDSKEEMTFYQGHDLRIGETDIGDTCFYHSVSELIVHFKNNFTVGFAGRGLTERLDQVSCGLSGVMGLEGSWRDAEDGELSGKPIEQGSVDSVFGIRVKENWSATFAVGETIEEVSKILLGIPGYIALNVRRESASENLATRSEQVVRSNSGAGGRVVAAVDSDIMENNRSNYAYVWMRDAVLTATAMGENVDLVGFVPECDSGKFLWQKYHPLGHRGSTWHPWAGDRAFPYQMDETALLVSYGFRNGMADDRVQEWLNLLVGSIGVDGLPRPSWDLWEERFGVHFWTCATVAQAFFDAGDVARGGELVQAMGEHFHLVEGRIPRRVNDHIADASVLAGCLWCDAVRPKFMNQAVEMVEEHLLMTTNCRGVARYEGDYYCRVREGYPGNPWVICTMWLARAYFLQGRIDEADDLLVWCEDLASKSGMLSEQYHPDTREPLSVCPLTWSHAEYLESVRMIRG
ncbi:MAG: glycoside hydrolase family 15 protein [Fimbriimonadaceae bacterium]